MWRSAIDDAIERLERLRFVQVNDVVTLDATVPSAYLRFVEKIWQHFEGKHALYPPFRDTVVERPWAFRSNSDDAARLFGTDLRLRNLMALAKYGPMRMLDLRRIVGNERPHDESYDEAQFGRAGIVRVWGEGQSRSAMLDPGYPVASPLRRLLVALKRVYPLPPDLPGREQPVLPEPNNEPWVGDRLALFGTPVPTYILTSIGVMGWTFEALCCEISGGHYRKVVKKSMKRLEDEGVLQGDRPRRPGMDVRVVTVADDFPARDELMDLLKACVEAWPAIGASVNAAMNALTPKTKAHLKKRGLIQPL